MSNGKIKWYNDIKGYGFIETDDGKDVFVHRSGLAQSYLNPNVGDNVEYETQTGEKGLMAVNVKAM